MNRLSTRNGWIVMLFTAEAPSDKESFTIVMPPPNITGELHMGHALDNTLPDVLIRYNRMRGKNALFLPGTDHASIATEALVVQQLNEEGCHKRGARQRSIS